MNFSASLSKADFSVHCKTAFVPPWEESESLSTDLYAVLIFTTIGLLISLPFTVLLNLLVMAAVKSFRRLRTKSNILLACLAGTDFMVGLTVQPLLATVEFYFLNGISVQNEDNICRIENILLKLFEILCGVSLFHLVLISLERYLAIKHTFFYDNHVTGARLIIASAFAWMILLITTILRSFDISLQIIAIGIDDILIICSIPVIIIFHVVVYIEVRRHEKQIISQQVSMEVTEKLVKERKALKTTTIIILTVFLCYFPTIFYTYLEINVPDDIGNIVFFLVVALTLLNSLMNPLIYAARNREFRVAFVQLLVRKPIDQAEQIEMRIFRS